MFIVLEGTDGCGKTTQAQLLCTHFENTGRRVAHYHFPILENNVFGELIASYLRGEFGDIASLSPKLIGALYAANRRDMQPLLRAALEDDAVLVVDRYYASNLAYAGAKVAAADERDALIRWLIRTDLESFRNLEPDLTLFLDAPLRFSMSVNAQRNITQDRAYTEGKQDIHEAKAEYQARVQEVYRSLGLYLPHYDIIECGDGQGGMRSKESIAATIWERVEGLRRR